MAKTDRCHTNHDWEKVSALTFETCPKFLKFTVSIFITYFSLSGAICTVKWDMFFGVFFIFQGRWLEDSIVFFSVKVSPSLFISIQFNTRKTFLSQVFSETEITLLRFNWIKTLEQPLNGT